MLKETARFARWLWVVMIQCWGWIGAISTAIFALDYIPSLQPLIDSVFAREHRWWLLIAGFIALLISSFLAWRAEDRALEEYKYPTLQLEFHPSAPGYLFPSHLQEIDRDAMWVRVLPTTDSHVERCIGWLDDVSRWTGTAWIPIGLNGRRPLWWSEVHELRLPTGERPLEAKEVPIVLLRYKRA
jgi:hypothetical protein